MPVAKKPDLFAEAHTEVLNVGPAVGGFTEIITDSARLHKYMIKDVARLY